VGVTATDSVFAADRAVVSIDNSAPSTSTLNDRWNIVLNSEVRTFSWKSNLSYPASIADVRFRGSGTQVYVPYALQFVGLPTDVLKIEIVGRGGWVSSRQTSLDRWGDVQTVTDTAVSATATFLGIQGLQPFVAVSFNLPTGKPALFGPDANARMDSDLVEVASYGEGFNYGPTLGLTLSALQNLTTTFSAGYTRRGSFQREGTPTPDAPLALSPPIDPGEVLTGTATLGYQQGALTGTLTAQFSTETDTKFNGIANFRPGNRYSLNGRSSYSWPENAGITTLSASVAQTRPNKVEFLPIALPGYYGEPFNSNSTIYRVDLEHMVQWDKLAVGPLGSWLNRDNNSYDSNSLQFVSAKTRWSAGAQARLQANERISFNARLERVWIDQEKGYPDVPFSYLTQTFIPIPGTPPVKSTGWQGAIGATAQF
jgi:hypothetical protein